ncbi:MAG: hypothetical protein ACM3ZU_15965 [Bacteroidota bacterium]
MKTTVYDRQTLYEEVWKEPVSVVAQHYEVSDVALHKICKRLKIPVPGRGYWAQYRAGKNVKKAPLPKYEGPQRIVAVRNGSPNAPPSPTNPDKLGFLDDATREALSQVCSNIAVPEELEKPHPLVAEAERFFRQQKAQDDHPVVGLRPHTLDIRVTKTSSGRALRIMDTLIKALERLGHTVVVDKRSGRTVVQIGEEKLPIRLTERVKQVDHILTPQEAEKKRKGQYFWAPTHDYLPTSELALAIESYRIARRNWRDGKKKRLEGYLGSFIFALVQAAENERTWREEQERERQRRIEEELRRLELEHRREKEMERFKALEQDALDWQRARRIRDYVRAVEQNARRVKDRAERARRRKWIAWAKGKADWLDPLSRKADPILGTRKRSQEPSEDE